MKKKPEKPEQYQVYTPEYMSWQEKERADKIRTVETMMDDALDNFFATVSPNNPQETLAVIRLEDFYRIICDRLGVDPESTNYSAYGS